jgi:glycosyl transferase family 25
VSGLELLGSWFDRVLVVTIPRAAERQAAMAARLRGIPFEFVQGVDRRDLDLADLERRGVIDQRRAREVHRHGKPLTDGEVACSLSHRIAQRRILERGWRHALVLEDDAVADLDALSAAADVLQELPEDWGLLYLGYHLHEVRTPSLARKQLAYAALSRLRLVRWTPRQVANLYPRERSPHLARAGLHSGTYAYALTAAAAAKVIAEQEPVAYASDRVLSALVLRGELPAFIARPKLFVEAGQLAAGHATLLRD